VDVCIIGAGYVGLVTGACLAERGQQVTCVDADPEKVRVIRSGRTPIHEVGLDALLARNVGSRLKAEESLERLAETADVILLCVGTPFRDGTIDLSFVLRAAEQIGQVLARTRRYTVVVVKSTVIPGTTSGVFRETLERASGKVAGRDFGLGMNPEFLTEGTAVDDFMHPDRIVIGTIDARSREVLERLYAPWSDVPRVLTNTTTAEMIKYTSNAVLATLISFSNEIAALCTSVGDVDVADVMRGVHLANYFTVKTAAGAPSAAPITSFLAAGCGFGGSCLPKDVSAIVAQGRGHGLGMPLLNGVLEINREQPARVLDLVRRHYPSLQGVPVAVLGIAFKPDTDDVRESPAFPVLRQLLAAGARVTAYDPVARLPAGGEFTHVSVASSLEEAVRSAEVVILITRWKEFAELGPMLQRLGRSPVVVDGRRMLDPAAFARFEGIGRG
jgi:UDPglucose 6-dehydrogenase/GDP-mannose 6-dehydrogenase